MFLSIKEMLVIEEAKKSNCLYIRNNFGLTQESFTAAAYSLYQKGFLEGEPITINTDPYVHCIILKKSCLNYNLQHHFKEPKTINYYQSIKSFIYSLMF